MATFLFSIIVCLLLILIIYIFKKILNETNTKNFYLIISLAYFLLFYYNDFKIFIDFLNPLNPSTPQIINWRYYGEISILIIATIIFIIFFLNQKYKFFQNFLKTFIAFFLMINIIFIFFGHIKNFIINNVNQEKTLSINNIAISKFNEIKSYKIRNNNVYYIIFDGMISLENAKKQNIFFSEDKIQKIKKL